VVSVTVQALKPWPHILHALGRKVNELEMYSPPGKRLHMKLDEPFAIYSRVAFDSYLRDLARDAGAEVVFEKITQKGIKRIETNDIGRGSWRLRSAGAAEWSGQVLVGADGANSAIAKKLAGPIAASDI